MCMWVRPCIRVLVAENPEVGENQKSPRKMSRNVVDSTIFICHEGTHTRRPEKLGQTITGYWNRLILRGFLVLRSALSQFKRQVFLSFGFEIRPLIIICGMQDFLRHINVSSDNSRKNGIVNYGPLIFEPVEFQLCRNCGQLAWWFNFVVNWRKLSDMNSNFFSAR